MKDTKDENQVMLNKGDCMVCEVCGLSVTIDENHAYTENATLLCCGKSMEPKKKKGPAKK